MFSLKIGFYVTREYEGAREGIPHHTAFPQVIRPKIFSDLFPE